LLHFRKVLTVFCDVIVTLFPYSTNIKILAFVEYVTSDKPNSLINAALVSWYPDDWWLD